MRLTVAEKFEIVERIYKNHRHAGCMYCVAPGLDDNASACDNCYYNKATGMFHGPDNSVRFMKSSLAKFAKKHTKKHSHPAKGERFVFGAHCLRCRSQVVQGLEYCIFCQGKSGFTFPDLREKEIPGDKITNINIPKYLGWEVDGQIVCTKCLVEGIKDGTTDDEFEKALLKRKKIQQPKKEFVKDLFRGVRKKAPVCKKCGLGLDSPEARRACSGLTPLVILLGAKKDPHAFGF